MTHSRLIMTHSRIFPVFVLSQVYSACLFWYMTLLMYSSRVIFLIFCSSCSSSFILYLKPTSCIPIFSISLFCSLSPYVCIHRCNSIESKFFVLLVMVGHTGGIQSKRKKGNAFLHLAKFTAVQQLALFAPNVEITLERIEKDGATCLTVRVRGIVELQYELKKTDGNLYPWDRIRPSSVPRQITEGNLWSRTNKERKRQSRHFVLKLSRYIDYRGKGS